MKLKSNITLSEAERITLQQLALNHRHRDIRTRGTGLLMLARGIKPRQIAAEIGCSLRVIYDWVHFWHDSGIAGLLGGHVGGRYPAMTPDMITTAVEAASAESLTLARIAQKVEDKHGPLPCTLETLANTLKKQGLTYKRARLSLKKCNEAEFAEKAALLNKIKAGARSGHYRLVYLDEAGFTASPPVQYGWSPRGKPHETEPQNHVRRSVLGALNYTDNTLFYQIMSDSVTRTDVIDFLEQVAKQGDHRLTFVVLDNARIHHRIDEKIKSRWLREHNLFLLYLPAYSPELNLIEIVWRQAKYHWRRFITWTQDTMDHELNTLFESYGRQFAVNFS